MLLTARRAFLALAVALLAQPVASAETKKADMGWTYSIRNPEHLEKGGAPLIVGFHDTASTHETFNQLLSGFDFLKNSVIVTPSPPRGATQGWDFSVDVPKAGEFLEEIEKSVKPTRTIVVGFSRGAAFALAVCLQFPKMQGAILIACAPTEQKEKGGGYASVAYYLIHGTADQVFYPQVGKQVHKMLDDLGLPQVHFELVTGLGHVLDHDSFRAGFAWLDKVLGPAVLVLTETEATDRMKALEQAIKVKDWEAVKTGLAACEGMPKKLFGKLSGIVKNLLNSTEEGVGAAAIAFCGKLGNDGVTLLKSIPATNEVTAPLACEALGKSDMPSAIDPLLNYLKAKSETVSTAAIEALGTLKCGDQSGMALANGLEHFEKNKVTGARVDRICEILGKQYEEDFKTSKEWKKYISEGQKTEQKDKK